MPLAFELIFKYRKNNQPRGETETEFVADCKKHFLEKKNMSHGILTMMCLEHERLFLYAHLKAPESVDNYFSNLVMFYPELESPTDFICDNPCNGQPYLMYREPAKFEKMQCFSDVFHGWTGHVCGPLYCAKLWKEVNQYLRNVNTSLVESTNNIIQRMNISAIWMNLPTFNLYMTQMLEITNRKGIRADEGKIVI